MGEPALIVDDDVYVMLAAPAHGLDGLRRRAHELHCAREYFRRTYDRDDASRVNRLHGALTAAHAALRAAGREQLTAHRERVHADIRAVCADLDAEIEVLVDCCKPLVLAAGVGENPAVQALVHRWPSALWAALAGDGAWSYALTLTAGGVRWTRADPEDERFRSLRD